MIFYLTYYLGDNSYSKNFTSMYELENFLNKLCEIRQVYEINLDGCVYSLKEKTEGDGK